MKKLRIKNCRIIVICTIILLPVTLIMINNPLLRTDAAVRRHLLRVTPIGTCIEDVIRIANNRYDWTVENIRLDAGLSMHPSIPRSPIRFVRGDERFPTVGKQAVHIYFGTYQFIVRYSIEGFYAFNEEGKLIDIFVARDFDLP